MPLLKYASNPIFPNDETHWIFTRVPDHDMPTPKHFPNLSSATPPTFKNTTLPQYCHNPLTGHNTASERGRDVLCLGRVWQEHCLTSCYTLPRPRSRCPAVSATPQRPRSRVLLSRPKRNFLPASGAPRFHIRNPKPAFPRHTATCQTPECLCESPHLHRSPGAQARLEQRRHTSQLDTFEATCGASAPVQALATYHGQLSTVANGCEHKGNVEQTDPQPPNLQKREPLLRIREKHPSKRCVMFHVLYAIPAMKFELIDDCPKRMTQMVQSLSSAKFISQNICQPQRYGCWIVEPCTPIDRVNIPG